jgi:hypothetical protein
MRYIEALAISLLAVLAPIQAVMITVGTLIMFDLITGVAAALKRGEKVSSAALRRTISKMFIYNICVVSGFIFEKYLMGDFIPVTKIIASTIGAVDLKSIVENADVLNGSPIFVSLIKALGSQNDKPKAEE